LPTTLWHPTYSPTPLFRPATARRKLIKHRISLCPTAVYHSRGVVSTLSSPDDTVHKNWHVTTLSSSRICWSIKTGKFVRIIINRLYFVFPSSHDTMSVSKNHSNTFRRAWLNIAIKVDSFLENSTRVVSYGELYIVCVSHVAIITTIAYS